MSFQGRKVCFPPLENERSPRGADGQTAYLIVESTISKIFCTLAKNR